MFETGSVDTISRRQPLFSRVAGARAACSPQTDLPLCAEAIVTSRKRDEAKGETDSVAALGAEESSSSRPVFVDRVKAI
jgi:hypothetical protein